MLLFIRGGIKKREWLSGVSIHLILLFISTASSANRRAASFNTSHVTLYLRGSWRMWREDGSFNTSHVTLYLLINYLKEFWNYGFNTSHVTLYRQRNTLPVLYLYGVSIHLMLLFINKTGGVSCTLYRVSIHLMLLFIQKTWFIWDRTLSFNTSHVTLYLSNHAGPKSSIALFQYISCYSLSVLLCSESVIYSAFQYISCYSLSVWHTDWQDKRHVSIHLMLLFIK